MATYNRPRWATGEPAEDSYEAYLAQFEEEEGEDE
jgi:hypothetical protein